MQPVVRRLYRLAFVGALLAFMNVARADAPALPAPLCALVAAHVICYDAQTAAPFPVTPPDAVVLDFAISPDGGWLAYRSAGAVLIASLDGQTPPRVLDPQAAPSAELAADSTLSWSPDGLGIAYVTAGGLRVIYPAEPGKHSADVQDRAYSRVLWSPGGGRLAAQSDDGFWTFFACDRSGSIKVTRVWNQPAEAAWLNDNAVIIALTAGGMVAVDPATASAPPIWYIANERFIRLHAGAENEVVALHPDPGDTIGSAVSIGADGKWKTLGTAKLDSRLEWGPAPADHLLYITSGTPILVDRATGSEDMLPISHVERVIWGPAPLPTVLGVAMDADLYFIAADSSGVPQVWRLPRDGFPLINLSQSVVPVVRYAVYGDVIQYSAGGVTADVHPDGSSVLPAIATAGSLPTATLAPTATPPPTETLHTIGWQPGPTVLQKINATGTAGSAYFLLERATLSPSGKFAAGYRGTHFVILNWSNGKAVTLQGIQAPSDVRWAS